eukprot:TRINITY_DN37734_c0_g1_i1.p1 TRINITY_DN37734_c0_g1~~TRINITY_DN37734_c0_g1_i1.p1  ORF type:complete len:929 (-),score=105.89 TRINITY_DN37734_c0_g1_i1:396-3182(-)
MSDVFAILPSSMGKDPPGDKKKGRQNVSKFMPTEVGGLVMKDPNDSGCPYSFSDSPEYTRMLALEKDARRGAELEGRDETRGFFKSVEELGKTQKWDEAFQLLERRTSIPSGLFLVTRAILRWRFSKFGGSLHDAEQALKTYANSQHAGPLAAAFCCVARVCFGSAVQDSASCSREMRSHVNAWEVAERTSLREHPLGRGLFHPRVEHCLREPQRVDGVDDMEARDGSYVAAPGVRISYTFLKNHRDMGAPVLVHFHDPWETAADFRSSKSLASRYRDLPVHLLVVDYRGYGWSDSEPSLADCLCDAEPFAERIGETLVTHGLSWPYAGGLVLSGRSVGAHVAIHLAALFPNLFRSLILDSPMATSACGDRLGRGLERTEAITCWRKELQHANMHVLEPLVADMRAVDDIEKLRAFEGNLLVIHGQADEDVLLETIEGLHMAASSKQKELVVVTDATHGDINQFESYWDALRRFCLRAPLHGSLPSVRSEVEHLCPVCAERATSKCGRCQKVWYCGRAHQAEHWKIHKQSCATQQPEQLQSKKVTEGEACLVAAMAVNVQYDSDFEALSCCMESFLAQEGPALHSLCVAWHAPDFALAVRVRQYFENLEKTCQDVAVSSMILESPHARRIFEHMKSTLATVWKTLPEHSWVVMVELPKTRQLWSQHYTQLLLPTLRIAAADVRTVAVRCSRCVRATLRAGVSKMDSRQLTSGNELSGDDESSGAKPASPRRPDAVSLALSHGLAELCDSTEPCLSEFVVSVKVLRAFLETEIPSVLGHHLCAHRFIHKLSHSFGRRVRDFVPAKNEWVRWEQPSEEYVHDEEVDQFDYSKGRELWHSTPGIREQGTTEQDIVLAVACLRRSLDRLLIQSAREQLSRKDLRELVRGCTTSFLQACGLDAAIGVHRWTRDVANEISERALTAFAITITDQ